MKKRDTSPDTCLLFCPRHQLVPPFHKINRSCSSATSFTALLGTIEALVGNNVPWWLRGPSAHGPFSFSSPCFSYWHRILLFRWHVIFAFAARMIARTAEDSFTFYYHVLGGVNCRTVATTTTGAFDSSGHRRILTCRLHRRAPRVGIIRADTVIEWRKQGARHD
jgi:hypothetical protein